MPDRFFEGNNFVFYNDNSNDVSITAPKGSYLNMPTTLALGIHLQYMHELSDFPTPIAGVIYLEAGKTYVMVENIDLLGNRFECLGVCIFKGLSSETCYLSSTGLADGVALFTTVYTIIFQDYTITGVHTCFNILSNSSANVADWDKFNLLNIPNIGLISDMGNWILTNSAWINSSGCVFTGTVRTIGFMNCLITNQQALAGYTLTFDDNCSVTRRLKIENSALQASSPMGIINFSVLASVFNQGYIISSCNFAGTGTYLTGVQSDDNKALFFKNLGISNSRSTGSFYLSAEAATTTVVNTWVKIAGTTLPGTINQKFTHASNRLTVDSSLTEIYTCGYHVSLTTTNNNIIRVGISLNGADPLVDSFSLQTADSAGRISTQGSSSFLELVQNDYIELWIRNETASNPVTVSSMNISVSGEF